MSDTKNGMGPGSAGGNAPGAAPANPMAGRHVYGPRPVGALVPVVTRAAFKARSPAVAAVLADWASIVGPKTAADATPRRLTSGTLTLSCAGPVAMELQHLSGPLIERVNSHLGKPVVQRLRFVQDTTPPPPPAPKRRVAPKPVELPGIPAGDLRDALMRLGQSVGQPRERA